MSTFFLLLSLLFGVLAYNLYRPNYKHLKISTLSFLAGWLTGELALHHIVWQVTVVALFIWAGVVEGAGGALGMVICIAAWFAMGYFYLRGNEAKNEIESALSEGLGDNYQGQIKDEFSAQFPDTPNFAAIRKPFSKHRPNVEIIKDIPFGSYSQALDIYRPRDENKNMPVLFQIHGGAWTEKLGSKNEQAIPLMTHMANRGWISVASSYRLSPTATFPEQIIDCKEAIVWIKAHIAEYGGNPDFIVVTGGSAGGHLSSLMALSANDPDFQPGFEGEDTSLQGAVPFYGVYDFTNKNGLQHHHGQRELFESSIMKKSFTGNEAEYEQVSPMFRLHKDAPPFLIIHGDKDTLVPVEEARVFANDLREISSSPVSYAEISGGQHAFDMFPSVRSEHVKHVVEQFLAYLYSDYLRRSNSGNQKFKA